MILRAGTALMVGLALVGGAQAQLTEGNPYFLKKNQTKDNPYFLKKKQPDAKKTADGGGGEAGVASQHLTKDGKLTAALEVRDEKRGFGIFFGTTWSIAQDGRWTSTRIYRNKPRVRGSGQLTKKELILLAKTLDQTQPATLQSVGRPLVNPHVLTISYGGNRGELIIGVDQRTRPAAPGQGLLSASQRYGTILSTVRGIIDPKVGPEPPLPRRLR